MKNKNNDVTLCFICDKEMTSDILIKNYCKLCGMMIENNQNKFCCNSCKETFTKIKLGAL